eukprot:TRINITY_DN84467_c0_g1_i1.p1 TRINITY_DN84467_c0_g1~~TRINITY_DN84467_c0_g1_i1.p1  ORF type:complete len:340 (+),score=50.35 TRINITY_DN84467_c0_g1_i1:89-1021(+)
MGAGHPSQSHGDFRGPLGDEARHGDKTILPHLLPSPGGGDLVLPSVAAVRTSSSKSTSSDASSTDSDGRSTASTSSTCSTTSHGLKRKRPSSAVPSDMVPAKGILCKRQKTQPGLQSAFSWIFPPQAAGSCSATPGSAGGATSAMNESRRVRFRPSVEIIEFSRRLDGGGAVPGCGGAVVAGRGKTVSLGLGRPVRRFLQELSDSQGGSNPIPVPEAERLKMLRDCMGDAVYFKLWPKHRCETRRLQRERTKSLEEADAHGDPQVSTTKFMPRSLCEAQERAARLALEVAGCRAVCLSSCLHRAKRLRTS